MADDLQVGGIGVDIQVTLHQGGVVKDLSGTTTRYLYLSRPNGGRTTRFSASLVAGGLTGKMKYTTTAATDIDVAGDWTIQAFYINSAGSYSSERGRLVVLPNTY